jgi:hypothetical protein
MKYDFLDRYSKNIHISNLRKICRLGAELFHAERRTNMTKLIVALRNFANATKNVLKLNTLDGFCFEKKPFVDPWFCVCPIEVTCCF